MAVPPTFVREQSIIWGPSFSVPATTTLFLPLGPLSTSLSCALLSSYILSTSLFFLWGPPFLALFPRPGRLSLDPGVTDSLVVLPTFQNSFSISVQLNNLSQGEDLAKPCLVMSHIITSLLLISTRDSQSLFCYDSRLSPSTAYGTCFSQPSRSSDIVHCRPNLFQEGKGMQLSAPGILGLD